MGKLIVLYLLIPPLLRFRFRKSPRLREKVNPWFLAFTAMILLAIFPWGAAPGTNIARVIQSTRLVLALALLVYLVVDIRKTVH